VRLNALPSPSRSALRGESFITRIWRSMRSRAQRGPVAKVLDLSALRDAKLAEAASSDPGPFIDFAGPEPIILTSDDVTGAMLAHIEKGLRMRTLHQMPLRTWWDELARLASEVRR